MNKKTVSYLLKQKNVKKITMLTCYDYSTARILNDTDIDMLLIGDSGGNVFAGYETTVPVTVDEIIYHTKAVKRGANKPFILSDMPFMSYQASNEEGMRNAGRLMKEGLADGVKLEGGEEIADLVYKMTRSGIPVTGHIGLQPQSVHAMGGYKIVGKTDKEIEKLLKDAKALQDAGAFCIVLELVPAQTAKIVSEAIRIPTIGIGSGHFCDGQVLVINDMLGLNPDNLKHNKKYLNLFEQIKTAANQYITEVEKQAFPGKENSF